MAHMAVASIDELIEGIDRLANEDMVDEMLKAVGQVYVDQWKKTLIAKGHNKEQQMAETVDYDLVTYYANDGVVIYPMGKSSHLRYRRKRLSKKNPAKISFAGIAYILHYGRGANANGKGAIQGDKFVDIVEKNAYDSAISAAQKKLDQLTGKL